MVFLYLKTWLVLVHRSDWSVLTCALNSRILYMKNFLLVSTVLAVNQTQTFYWLLKISWAIEKHPISFYIQIYIFKPRTVWASKLQKTNDISNSRAKCQARSFNWRIITVNVVSPSNNDLDIWMRWFDWWTNRPGLPREIRRQWRYIKMWTTLEKLMRRGARRRVKFFCLCSSLQTM